MLLALATSEDFGLLRDRLDFYLRNKKHEDVVIISGGARGADKLAIQYANLRGLKCEIYYANWKQYGKRAGYLRNEKMAHVGHACVAFWDGKSRGTEMMIKLAKKYQLLTRVVSFA